MSIESETAYGDSSSAARAIHSALYGLEAAPPGHRVTKWAFTWNVDGTMATAAAYEGASLLFTLSYAWTDGNLESVERT
jgi:hypothetical protein